MPAQLINGTALSQQIRADVARRAAALTARGVRPGRSRATALPAQDAGSRFDEAGRMLPHQFTRLALEPGVVKFATKGKNKGAGN